jgi:hypothetical protein
VEIALSAICGPEDIVCPITPIDELKRLEVDAGARNYSEDRAAELRYLDCSKPLRRILTEFCIPASAYYIRMSLCGVHRPHSPAAEEYRVKCLERNPYAKIIY